MDDREMLELAAKASGVNGVWHSEWKCLTHVGVPAIVGSGGQTRCVWAPLDDDGDALRLAVKLNMGISVPVHRTIRADVITFRDSTVNIRETGDDPYAATRRAIVRAAAEIGRTLK